MNASRRSTTPTRDPPTPFPGFGSLPADRVLGLSKLARVVDFYSHRPQTQERLTQLVAEHLQTHLRPRGAGVVIEAEHTCMTLRGVKKPGAVTITSAVLGGFRRDPRTRAEAMALIKG